VTEYDRETEYNREICYSLQATPYGLPVITGLLGLLVRASMGHPESLGANPHPLPHPPEEGGARAHTHTHVVANNMELGINREHAICTAAIPFNCRARDRSTNRGGRAGVSGRI